jgi:hypothetical protein
LTLNTRKKNEIGVIIINNAVKKNSNIFTNILNELYASAVRIKYNTKRKDSRNTIDAI